MAYGKIVPGLKIDGHGTDIYGVVNERAVRAGAGLMFAIGFFTLLDVYFERNLTVAFVVVSIFFLDFLLKVFVGPRASIFGRIGTLLTRGQKPEFVRAEEKRFAWSLALVISGTVLALVGKQLFFTPVCAGAPAFAAGSPCLIPMTLCALCLTIMWLESAVGFCVGCALYRILVRRRILRQG